MKRLLLPFTAALLLILLGVTVASGGRPDLIFGNGFSGSAAGGCPPGAPAAADGLLDLGCVQAFVPPDPALVAPPLDPTVPPNVADATEFLYTGSAPIQRGVAPGTIARYRAGVIRGLVKDQSEQPLAGVLVRVLDHPELGYTYTRSDGMFDLAVKAGGALTVDYQKAGFLRAQRTLDTQWQDWRWADDAILLALDTVVTPVSTDGNSPQQVARGSLQTDVDGSRQATLIFPAGVTARLAFANGGSQPINSLSVRATEYTVGPLGRVRMPAAIPPSSAYTYAVELSADEAQAAGAQSVQFSAPVAVYFENFLEAPVGTVIPVGSYHFRFAQWLPENNGRVLQVLAITAGLAELDLHGNGQTASEDDYAQHGIDTAERARLAQLYPVGSQLWRFMAQHFTPWDCNVSTIPGPDDSPPPEQPATPDEPADDPCPAGGACENGDDNPDSAEPEEPEGDHPKPEEKNCGSVIGCESGSLRETIPLAGTAMRLVYDSEKVPARQSVISDVSIRVRVTASQLPSALRQATVNLFSLGTRTVYTYPRAALVPNMVVSLRPPGVDAYVRQWNAPFASEARLTYSYPWRLAQSTAEFGRAWAQFGSLSGLTFTRQWSELTGYQVTRAVNSVLSATHIASGARRAGSWDARGQGFGGWTLSDHHVFDPTAMRMYVGSGGSYHIGLSSHAEITTVRNLPLPSAGLIGAEQVTTAADGSIFMVANAPGPTFSDAIYRLLPGGSLQLWADVCAPEIGANCSTDLTGVIKSLSIDNLGRPLFTDGTRIFEISAQGQGRAIAHRNAMPGTCDAIRHVAGRDGRVFFVCNEMGSPGRAAGHKAGQKDNHPNDWIGSIWADGQVTRLAGGGIDTADNIGAAELRLRETNGLAVDPGGNILVSQTNVVWKITPLGVAQKIIGNDTNTFTPDGQQARGAGAGFIHRMQLAADGRVLLFDNSAQTLREIRPDGRLATIAGGGAELLSNSPRAGDIARRVRLDVAGMAALPEGSMVMVASQGIHSPSTITSFANTSYTQFGSLDANPQRYLIPNRSGAQYFLFDRQGRHLETRRSDTGSLIRRFEYNPRGYVIAVVDAFANRTTVERGAADRPLAVVNPDGVRTSFGLDSNGYLSAVDAAGVRSWAMTYRSDGLMTVWRDPRQAETRFEWSNTRLVGHTDALDNRRSLLPTNWRSLRYERRTLTSREGRVSSYNSDRDFDGSGSRQVSKSNGLAYIVTEDTKGRTSTEGRNGRAVQTITQQAPDPRFGLAAAYMSTETTSHLGSLRRVQRSRQAVPIVADAQLGQLDLYENVNVNGRIYVTAFDAAARLWTSSSPTGRVVSLRINANGQPIQQSVAGLAPIHYGYDTRGRLTSIAAGEGALRRETVFTYDARGYLHTVRDPNQRTTTFTNDAIGRVTQQQLPDLREIGVRFDGNSNVSGITPPGRSEHRFEFTLLNDLQRYTPPSLPGLGRVDTVYAYNRDQQLTTIDLPDARLTTASYAQATEFLNRLSTPTRVVEYLRDQAGRVTQASVDGQPVNTVGYAGDLLSRDGNVYLSHDHNFWLQAISFASGGATSEYSYDTDGLLTRAVLKEAIDGTNAITLTLARDLSNGLLTGSTAPRVTDSWQYNPFAEPLDYSAAINGAAVYRYTFERDLLGRIIQKTERIEGLTTVTDYVYDLAGRLDTVTVDGVLRSDYAYDANSNRAQVTYRDAAGTPSIRAGSFDAQDRMQSYGPWTYQYDPNGELAQRTESASGDVTDYLYDEFGNLRAVDLPDGREIRYQDDAFNRRTVKTIDGVEVQRFAYMNQLDPVAELTPTGNVIATYAYAERGHSPSLMRKAGQTYRILTDHLGSIRLVVDVATGTIVQRMDYDEFGRVTQDTNPGFQPFGYAGGIYDRDTGLVRFGARDYDAVSGRWTSKDPNRFHNGEVNLYAYVGGDPIGYLDSDGLTREDIDRLTALVNSEHPDLNSPLPGRINTAPIKDGTAYTNPLTLRVTLDDVYLGELNDLQRMRLFEAIIHESIHRTRDRSDMLRRPFDHEDIYDEAESRRQAVDEYICY